jgi:hypothetical protein
MIQTKQQCVAREQRKKYKLNQEQQQGQHLPIRHAGRLVISFNNCQAFWSTPGLPFLFGETDKYYSGMVWWLDFRDFVG